MAANFKILKYRNSDNLHLRLVGDFDGSAALELTNTLEKESAMGINRIFVHTCNLSAMLPFGEHIFLKHCKMSRGIPIDRLVFTGDFSTQMAPPRSGFITPEEGMSHPSYRTN